MAGGLTVLRSTNTLSEALVPAGEGLFFSLQPAAASFSGMSISFKNNTV
jgi:hypothetical protein